jgi:hypothetical protein
MYASETAVGKFKEPEGINTGVAYGYVDPSNQERTNRITTALQQWTNSTCDTCNDYQTADKHPWEQGCLERLLNESVSMQAVINISQQHMNTWNGPWGEYARHAWGGPGKELRSWVFEDMTLTHRIDVEKSIARIEATMLGKDMKFAPPCKPTPAEREINTN